MGNSYRIDQIYCILLRDKQATVEDLAEVFHVTPTTIRRDLLTLEEKKLIYRTRGSAFLLESGKAEANIFVDEKKRIATAAAAFIKPNMSIALDSGSTIGALVTHLVNDQNMYNLDFITHSPVNALNISKRFNTSIPGGSLVPNSEFMVGIEVEEFYKNVHVDLAFLGSTGVYNCSGLTVSYPLQLQVKRYSAMCADMRIALLDSSKFSRRGIYVFCDFNDIDVLITVKTKENESQIQRIQDLGVEVILV